MTPIYSISQLPNYVLTTIQKSTYSCEISLSEFNKLDATINTVCTSTFEIRETYTHTVLPTLAFATWLFLILRGRLVQKCKKQLKAIHRKSMTIIHLPYKGF